MKSAQKFFIQTLATLSLFLCLSVPVYGALPDYTTLAPLPGTTIVKDCVGNTCKTNFETYLPGLFNLAIGIAAVLAFVMITWGGIEYMTTDAISGKESGRERVTEAVKGLILVIGAWALLFTINPNILKFNLNIDAIKSDIFNPATSTPSGSGGGRGILPGYSLTPAQVAENEAIVNQLKSNGNNVSVNNGGKPCSKGEIYGCTNLVGLPQSTLNGITQFQKDCKCTIQITGGTEGGHSDHGPGKAIIDLSPTSNLTAYLDKNGVKTNRGIVVKLSNGQTATLIYENKGDNGGRSTAPHYHVTLP